MDFKRATDRLFDKIDHEELAQELGVSVAAIRQARLREGARASRAPPPEWRSAVQALAERRLSHYAALLADLKTEDGARKAAAVSAFRSQISGASMTDLDLQQSFFDEEPSYSDAASYTAVLLSQGKHRFYSLAMPSEVLGRCCIVEPRARNPKEGFQRLLDERRAQEIADYIDTDFGTIPSAIILSAQPEAELQYIRKTRTLKFNITPRSFLIIDGQHRVYGFSLAKSTLRVPVVIYSGLSRPDECRIFMDVNTKQRPVPNELLLDIKRLAETESDAEALMKDTFDAFNHDGESPLLGLMSPSDRRQGKISRVTFNAALKQILPTFADNDASTVYQILSAYLHACIAGLRTHEAEDKITNRTVFRSLLMLFPLIAERVDDRTAGKFTVENFATVLDPMFSRIRKNDLQSPGGSPTALFEIMRKASTSTFTIAKG